MLVKRNDLLTIGGRGANFTANAVKNARGQSSLSSRRWAAGGSPADVKSVAADEERKRLNAAVAGANASQATSELAALRRDITQLPQNISQTKFLAMG